MKVSIVYRGKDIDVQYDYQPEEKSTNDYPGCNEEFEVEQVFFKGVDIIDFLEDTQLEEIEELIKKL